MAWSDSFTEAWRFQGYDTSKEGLNDCALDSSNNFFFVGTTDYASAQLDDDSALEVIRADFALTKMDDTSGDPIWAQTDSHGNDTVDILRGIVVDSNGDVLVCGTKLDAWTMTYEDNTTQIVVMKFDGSNGSKLWQYDAIPANATHFEGDAAPYAMAVDDADNAYVAGHVTGHLTDVEVTSDSFTDLFIIKLNGENGTEHWTVQHGNAENTTRVYRMKADSDGDLFLAGNKKNDASGTFNMNAVKADGNDGSIIWQHLRETDGADYAIGIDIDASGDVYMGGSQDVDGTSFLADTGVVIKLDGYTGDEVWTYNMSSGSHTTVVAVAVDPITGNVAAAGSTSANWTEGAALGENDLAAVILDSETGKEIARYQNGTSGDDLIRCVRYSSYGSLYLAGTVSGRWTENSTGTKDFMVVKFDPVNSGVIPTETPSTDVDNYNGNNGAGIEDWQLHVIAAAGLCFLVLCLSGIWYMRRRRINGTKKSRISVRPAQGYADGRGHRNIFLPTAVFSRKDYPPMAGSCQAIPPGQVDACQPPPAYSEAVSKNMC